MRAGATVAFTRSGAWPFTSPRPESCRSRRRTPPGVRGPLPLKAYSGLPGNPAGPFEHLVHHSDCDGYYVPVDFAQVIVSDSLAGGYLGSSVRLLAELRRIAGFLGLPEDLDPDSQEVFDAYDAQPRPADGWHRYGVESYVSLQLIRAAKHSIATGAAVAFY